MALPMLPPTQNAERMTRATLRLRTSPRPFYLGLREDGSAWHQRRRATEPRDIGALAERGEADPVGAGWRQRDRPIRFEDEELPAFGLG